MQPGPFLELLWRERASAILRTDDQQKAHDAMEAAVRGGFKVIEFTLTVPGVFELIQDFSRREGVVVGAGTVLTPDDARRAVDAGARFLVSPVTDPEVIHVAHELGVTAMPGTHTATDMWHAHQAKAQLCKLFPAPAGGPAYVRSVLGPTPFLRIVPTNGVDAENVGAWFAAGVFAVGFVAPLFQADDVQTKAEELLKKTHAAERPDREWSFEA